MYHSLQISLRLKGSCDHHDNMEEGRSCQKNGNEKEKEGHQVGEMGKFVVTKKKYGDVVRRKKRKRV